MKIAFFASGISPHIAPVCDQIYQRYGENFRFFGTDAKPIKAMEIMGAGNLHKEKKYFYNVNDNEEYMNMSMDWARNADVAIIGCSNCYHYMDIRFSQGNKLTFKLRERLFKNGYYDENDKKLQYKIDNQIKKYIDNDLFFLCAGLYAPYDFVTIGVPKNKLIKWGYFPRNSYYNYEEFSRNFHGKINLIWVGRFVREKLSHNAILATEKLVQMGYDIHLSMIGYGEDEKKLKKYVTDNMLSDRITFLGAKNEMEIREELRKSHIFLMTSNYEEGWGVVVNEAMSEGCVPVVSYSTGAADMLIEDNSCGRLFVHDNLEDLVFQIKSLIDDREVLSDMSRKAYYQVVNLWNATIATERLIECIEKIIQERDLPRYQSGPCGIINIYESEEDVKAKIKNGRI